MFRVKHTSLFPEYQQRRIFVSFIIGIFSTIVFISLHSHYDVDKILIDMGWALNAARDLWAGRDPYRHEPSMFLVPYPLTAAIIIFPLAFLPAIIGFAVLFGIVSTCLAYALTRDNQYWRLLIFVSPSYIMALKSIQWSPIFMLVLFFPAIAPVLLAKPTIALPIAFSIKWTPLRLLTTALIGIIPFLLIPDWHWRWIEQVKNYGGFIPLLSVLGPIFLVVVLFFHEFRARIFFIMTLLPQHRFFYDQLFLWIIPKSYRQMLTLTTFSWAGFYYTLTNFKTLWVDEIYLLTTFYLPAFLMILWQQPIVRWRCYALASIIALKKSREYDEI